MDEVNNLSLGYFPLNSPDVLGDIEGATSFPECNLDSDQSV